MKPTPYGDIVARIERLLDESGQMTRAEICQALNIDRARVSAVISRMARPTKTLPKRIFVVGYVHDSEGLRRYPRAIYQMGDKPDAKRPKPNRKAARRRYDQNVRRRLTGSSVFNWGMTRREYTELQRRLTKARSA